MQMYCTSQVARGLLWRLPATPLRPMPQVICALQGMNVPVPAFCSFHKFASHPPVARHCWLGPQLKAACVSLKGSRRRSGWLDSCHARAIKKGCLDPENAGLQRWTPKLQPC